MAKWRAGRRLLHASPSSCNLSDLCQQRPLKTCRNPHIPKNSAKFPLKKEQWNGVRTQTFLKSHEKLQHEGEQHSPNIPKYTIMYQNIPEYTKTSPNIPKYTKTSQIIIKYAKMCQSIPKYIIMYQNIPKCARVHLHLFI